MLFILWLKLLLLLSVSIYWSILQIELYPLSTEEQDIILASYSPIKEPLILLAALISIFKTPRPGCFAVSIIDLFLLWNDSFISSEESSLLFSEPILLATLLVTLVEERAGYLILPS